MKILVMGGTRFVGKSLVNKLVEQNHIIDIFTRGNKPSPYGINKSIRGDRNNIHDISKLKDFNYDFIFDISGRELEQTKMLLNNISDSFRRYIYVSSAGVYKNNCELPLSEDSPLDDDSRHKGKFETENWLLDNQIPFTSFRPTYIYGPGNYNKIENWFFERISIVKKVPIPNEGNLITQLGHVSDLTDAMIRSLSFECSKNNIYNCSGSKGITIKGLIEKCAEVCGVNFSEIELLPFDYKKLDTKSRKGFPIRLSHYQTSICKIKQDIDWEPYFDLKGGLQNSFDNDFKLKSNSSFDPNLDNILFNS